MKRAIKRFAFVGITLFGLLVIIASTERVRGKLALHARLRRLAQQNEELSSLKLRPHRSREEQNVFVALRNITNEINSVYSNFVDAPSGLFALPGKAVVLWQSDEWKTGTGQINSWSHFSEELGSFKQVVNKIRSAAERPDYDSGFDYEKGFLDFQLPQVSIVKKASQILNWSLLKALQENDLVGAGADLKALLQLTAKQTPEPLVICQLVRCSCASLAFNSTWQALQISGWTEIQLAAFQALWHQSNFEKDMARSFEMERALTIDFHERVKRSNKDLSFAIAQREQNGGLISETFGTLPTHGFVLKGLHLPFWRIAWADLDELAAINRWQTLIVRESIARTNGWTGLSGTANVQEQGWPDLTDSEEKLGWYNRLLRVFSSDLFGITDNMIRQVFSGEIQREMAMTAIAIERYRLHKGEIPQTLENLVPGYLEALPRDWMDGKPLRYQSKPGGSYALYSVGFDGKDDGGDPATAAENQSFRRIWDGRDAVWPTAASAAETKKAMKESKR